MTTYTFNKQGRCTAENLNAPFHKDTRHYFKLGKPNSDLKDVFQRTTSAFNYSGGLTFNQFEQKVTQLLKHTNSHSIISGLTNGPCLPYLIPKGDYSNAGQSLCDVFLPALEKSYQQKFPNYTFVNHATSDISQDIKNTFHSRYNNIVAAANTKDVIGLFFPCLSEYSIPACRELTEYFPEEISLGGAIDTTCALIGNPEILYNESAYPPLFWLAAMDTTNPHGNYHFEAYGYNLTFNRKIHFNETAEFWCAGVSLVLN